MILATKMYHILKKFSRRNTLKLQNVNGLFYKWINKNLIRGTMKHLLKAHYNNRCTCMYFITSKKKTQIFGRKMTLQHLHVTIFNLASGGSYVKIMHEANYEVVRFQYGTIRGFPNLCTSARNINKAKRCYMYTLVSQNSTLSINKLKHNLVYLAHTQHIFTDCDTNIHFYFFASYVSQITFVQKYTKK